MIDLHDNVAEYYGETLQSSDDLLTNACCTMTRPPEHIARLLPLIADEVKDKYYGCGLTIPSCVKGLDVLDLGSGSGRDCYLVSALVGEAGHVTGVDMTDAQLSTARKYIEHHRDAFGFRNSNVEFVKGNIEALDELEFNPASFDLVISNCVINLAADKQKVLDDVFRLLRPGGEIYFSDVYADRRVPLALREDKVLWGECLSGALYWNDFIGMARKAGFVDPRLVESHSISIHSEDVEKRVGDIRFYSASYRLMKIEGLEASCEDYGQAVVYNGGIDEEPHGFSLDAHHYFPKGKTIPVCGNTFRMIHQSRYRPFFDFFGNEDVHYGIFEGCGIVMPFQADDSSAAQASCC